MKKSDEFKFYNCFYIFIFGCLFGYIVEVLWSYYRHGIFINHSALVIGPFNVVYGISGLVFSYLLYKYREDNVIKLFLISFFIGSILEYSLSFGMEKLVGFVAWNYSRYPLNINGRICLKYSIFWGLLGVIWIKYIYPLLKNLIDMIPKKIGIKLKNVLIIFLLCDYVFSLQAVDRAKRYEVGIPPQSRYERFLDEYFGIDYLNNMFNYRWGKK